MLAFLPASSLNAGTPVKPPAALAAAGSRHMRARRRETASYAAAQEVSAATPDILASDPTYTLLERLSRVPRGKLRIEADGDNPQDAMTMQLLDDLYEDLEEIYCAS